MGKKINVKIIHETNPRKYYPALFLLRDKGLINITGKNRYSVIKEWIRSALKDRKPFVDRTKNALSDLLLRLKIPVVKDEVIVLGFAPWDWRVIMYMPLILKNKILYHTSWHNWDINNTPKQYIGLNYILRKIWLTFLNHPNVTPITINEVVQKSFEEKIGKEAKIIPHSVPSEFFKTTKRKDKKGPLKLIYVGEISEKKGIKKLINDLMKKIPEDKISLTLVGDGPLRELCIKNTSRKNINYIGPVYNRKKLAQIMAKHDILMLLSQRKKDWEELFGIVIIEALASGLGVIATNHIGPKCIFSDAEYNNLFEEEDIGNIINLLLKLSEDRKRLQKFKDEQKEIVKEYHIEEVAKKWYSVIENSL